MVDNTVNLTGSGILRKKKKTSGQIFEVGSTLGYLKWEEPP